MAYIFVAVFTGKIKKILTPKAFALPCILWITDGPSYKPIPQGPSPALIVAITLFELVSMTVTSLDKPLAV